MDLIKLCMVVDQISTIGFLLKLFYLRLFIYLVCGPEARWRSSCPGTRPGRGLWVLFLGKSLKDVRAKIFYSIDFFKTSTVDR